jgi:DNA-directed RNA polymerase subunit omega
MARVTIEDCLPSVKDRFELVVLAAERARKLAFGEEPLVQKDNEKFAVTALRESKLLDMNELRESVIKRNQKRLFVKIDDEPEQLDTVAELAFRAEMETFAANTARKRPKAENTEKDDD